MALPMVGGSGRNCSRGLPLHGLVMSSRTPFTHPAALLHADTAASMLTELAAVLSAAAEMTLALKTYALHF